MNRPRLTIIMPSFNQAAFLQDAICSILDQNYPNMEFMILDGGSTDGSREIIEKYATHLAFWYSQPDQGQSAAIDYGIKRGTGDLAGWLNSDDILLPGALDRIAEAYRVNPGPVIVSGNLVFIDAAGNTNGFLRMPAHADFFARRGVFAVSQPGSFFQRQAYLDLGGIRFDYHFVMDNELYLRMFLNNVKHCYLDRYLAAFRRHAQQKTTASRDRTDRESARLKIELGEKGYPYRTPPGLLVYYAWQLLNGNYFKKQLHLKKTRGRHWRTFLQ